MKPYSTFLYQAGQGKNHWGLYTRMFALAWGVPLVLQYIAEAFFIGTFGFESTLSAFIRSNFLRNSLSIVLLFYLLRRLHKRSGQSLINTESHIRWERLSYSFLVSAGLVFGLSALTMYMLYDQPLLWQWNTIDETSWGLLQKALYFPLTLLVYHLFFGSYLLQGITLAQKIPLRAILITGLISYLFSHADLLRIVFTGIFDSGISWRWFIHASVLIDFILMGVIVLDEGIELALGFTVGKSLYSILINEGAMYKQIFPDTPTFSDGFVYFFSFGGGSLICLAIFLFIMHKRFKLRDRKMLREPIPGFVDEKYDLIDQIGKE